MTNTPDATACLSAEERDSAQSPFFALRYHFGMLLGVSDLETEQAYHRGKMRLHNQWLHGEGVVWGFNVLFGTDADKKLTGELRVLPGLALDALGRELHLDADACLDVPAWFTAHRKDANFKFTESPEGAITFDAHVVIRFKTCLTRQVPALSEPCDNAGTATAYSRIFETVEIFLRAGPAPKRAVPYHRLRLLFGLAEPVLDHDGKVTLSDQEVLDAPDELASFRKFAALDEIDLRPPEGDEFPVVLAEIIGLTLAKNGEALTLTGGAIDVAVRPSHVATSTIQELLGGALEGAGGPLILPGSVKIDTTAGLKISFRTDADLAPLSVTPAAFSLTTFDDTAGGGWKNIPITAATLAGNRDVTITCAAPPAGKLYRFIAKGSGPAPILGANLVPLNNGRDFIQTQKRS